MPSPTPINVLEEKMAKARMRAEIASWNDDTTLESDLACVYLGLSPTKLEELRATDGQGPKILKYPDKNAKGRNRPVLYKLGELRDYQHRCTSSGSFDAAKKAYGMTGFMATLNPFFAKPEPRGRFSLLGDAWDDGDDEGAELLRLVMSGELSIAWLSPADAAVATWGRPAKHREIAAAWTRTLNEEAGAVRAAVERSEMSAECPERPTGPVRRDL